MTDKPNKPHAKRALHWRRATTKSGIVIVVPEVIDYELRRKLIHLNRPSSLLELDNLCETCLYLPITTSIMRRAAELWAEARRAGRPTARNESLDVDMILLAQAESLCEEYRIVTTNINHFDMSELALNWNIEVNNL